MSSSVSRQRTTCPTPSSPPSASPYTYGLARSTASAPSASALTTSAPVRAPPSDSTARPPAPPRRDDAGQRVQRGPRAVDLPAAVVGHHDAVHAGPDGAPRVVRVLDA